MKITKDKLSRRFRGPLVRRFRHKQWYYYLYPSYWHALLHPHRHADTSTLYFAACPNQGAGIGHQMANWMAGWHFAQYFGLKFAHMPFAPAGKWDVFMGFGLGEVTVRQLVKQQHYQVRRLPMFDADNTLEVQRIRQIISSYAGRRVVLLAEQDQFLRNLPLVSEHVQQKFFAAPIRTTEHVSYDSHNFNIAVHVRRGDILADPTNPNLRMRYLANDYYLRVLRQVTQRLHTARPVHIWLFSQGKPADFAEFNEFSNLHFCLDMSDTQSFLHFVYADLLITSKSSFSYKPALICRGYKVSPANFWHDYPQSEKWLLADDEGHLAEEQLCKLDNIE